MSALALPAVLFLPLLLPWLPAAWLVVGPGGTAVWAVTAVGLARRRGLPRALRVPALATALAGVVATIWMGGLARSVGANAMTGDAPHYLVIAQSLLADGDWDVGNQYDDESYRAFFNTRLTRPHVTTGPQGQRYSMHAPGTALLVLPGFAGFGPAGATATLVLLLAAASALFWRVVWRHTGQAEAAWFAWAALVASAPYALHAATIFPDGPAAAAAIVGLWLLVALAGGRGVSLGTLALCSAPLAALPWLHVRFAMVAGLLGAGVITLLIRERVDRAVRADRVAWWLMIPAISFALWLAVTFVMSGTMDPTSTMRSQYAPSPLMSVPFGLAGLLVDREFGLLQAAPVMLAAGAGWFALRAQPVLAWTTGAVVVGTFALTSAWGWAGGRAAPGRLVTVVVPVLAFWLGLAWAHGGRAMRQLLLLALVATATWTWHAATLDDGLRAYQSADGRLSVAEGLSTSVDLASALPSMFRDDAEPQTESAVAVLWILALLAGAGAVWAAHRRWSEPAAWLAGGVIAMATVAAAASAVWWVRDINPWTPRQAGLELARGASALP
ncbi:MAG TPA: hypothetical protein VMW48_16355, partial [Vicinamibacterales bacterium]|nr:hypothetical protein [Vicinamibacterales bacterium]